MAEILGPTQDLSHFSPFLGPSARNHQIMPYFTIQFQGYLNRHGQKSEKRNLEIKRLKDYARMNKVNGANCVTTICINRKREREKERERERN